jgi:hypothetical protein
MFRELVASLGRIIVCVCLSLHSMQILPRKYFHANILNLCCGAKTPLWGHILFLLRIGEPDMPKNARAAVAARTSAVLPAQSDSSQLVTIALFSGIGLLLSLIAILMGVPVVGY